MKFSLVLSISPVFSLIISLGMADPARALSPGEAADSCATLVISDVSRRPDFQDLPVSTEIKEMTGEKKPKKPKSELYGVVQRFHPFDSMADASKLENVVDYLNKIHPDFMRECAKAIGDINAACVNERETQKACIQKQEKILLSPLKKKNKVLFKLRD